MKKQPKQERSRQIVDAVLGGATRILSKMRLSEVTTNKIAEVAGVGIGSLYDYFPNKKSIVTSLIERRINQMAEDFRKVIRENPQHSLEEKILAVTAFLTRDTLARKGFLKEIFVIAPEAGLMDALYRARMGAVEEVSLFLRAKDFSLSTQDSNRKAFLAVHSTMGLLESYIMVDPDYLSPAMMSGELESMMRSFLLKKHLA